MPLKMNGTLPMQPLVSVPTPQLPVACISTTKIAAKANGKKPLAQPKNPSELSLEAKTFNKKAVTSLKKDRRKAQSVKRLNGFKVLRIVCVEGIFHPLLLGERELILCSVNAAAATLFGDAEDTQKNQQLHDQGKAQQRSAES